MIKKIIYFLIFTLFLASAANAGRLLRCEGVLTAQGYRYVGTYCYDSMCSYTYTRVFTTYCPWND